MNYFQNKASIISFFQKYEKTRTQIHQLPVQTFIPSMWNMMIVFNINPYFSQPI